METTTVQFPIEHIFSQDKFQNNWVKPKYLLHHLIAFKEPFEKIQQWVNDHMEYLDEREPSRGLTPLAVSIFVGDRDSEALLVKLGADPCIADERGWTPAHFAEVRQNHEMTQLLYTSKKANDLAKRMNCFKGTPQDLREHLQPRAFPSPTDQVFYLKKGKQVVAGTAQEFQQMTGMRFSNFVSVTPQALIFQWNRSFSPDFNEGTNQRRLKTFLECLKNPPKLYLQKNAKSPEYNVHACSDIEAFHGIAFYSGELIDGQIPNCEYVLGEINAKNQGNPATIIPDGFPNCIAIGLRYKGIFHAMIMSLRPIKAGEALFINQGFYHPVKWGKYRELNPEELRTFLKENNLKEVFEYTRRRLSHESLADKQLVLFEKLKYILDTPSLLIRLLAEGTLSTAELLEIVSGPDYYTVDLNQKKLKIILNLFIAIDAVFKDLAPKHKKSISLFIQKQSPDPKRAILALHLIAKNPAFIRSDSDWQEEVTKLLEEKFADFLDQLTTFLCFDSPMNPKDLDTGREKLLSAYGLVSLTAQIDALKLAKGLIDASPQLKRQDAKPIFEKILEITHPTAKHYFAVELAVEEPTESTPASPLSPAPVYFPVEELFSKQDYLERKVPTEYILHYLIALKQPFETIKRWAENHVKLLNVQEPKRGMTPIALCCAIGDRASAVVLFTLGADPTIPDVRGWTYAHFAELHRDRELIAFLRLSNQVRQAYKVSNHLGATPLTLRELLQPPAFPSPTDQVFHYLDEQGQVVPGTAEQFQEMTGAQFYNSIIVTSQALAAQWSKPSVGPHRLTNEWRELFLKLLMQQPQLYLQKSPEIRGHDVCAGEDIGEFQGVAVYAGELMENTTSDVDYLLGQTCAKDFRNLAGMISDGPPNCTPVPVVCNGLEWIMILSLRPIKKGERLLMDYGIYHPVKWAHHVQFNTDELIEFFQKRSLSELFEECCKPTESLDALNRQNALEQKLRYLLNTPSALIYLFSLGMLNVDEALKIIQDPWFQADSLNIKKMCEILNWCHQLEGHLKQKKEELSQSIQAFLREMSSNVEKTLLVLALLVERLEKVNSAEDWQSIKEAIETEIDESGDFELFLDTAKSILDQPKINPSALQEMEQKLLSYFEIMSLPLQQQASAALIPLYPHFSEETKTKFTTLLKKVVGLSLNKQT